MLCYSNGTDKNARKTLGDGTPLSQWGAYSATRDLLAGFRGPLRGSDKKRQ